MEQKIFNILQKLQALPDRQNKFWNVSPDTGNLLNMFTRMLQAQTVLEIGTSNGYSGIWFAEALSHTGGKLYTIESHKERFALARQHFEEAGVLPFVEQLFGHAPEIFSTDEFKRLGLSCDMIFLDATKMEYASYFENVAPLLKAGGLLVADNVQSHRDDLEEFVALVRKQEGFRVVELSMGAGLLLAYKE